AIIAAAEALPTTRSTLLATPGFKGRGADRYAARWTDAVAEALALEESALPPRTLRGDGPPPVRAWADKDPAAARRHTFGRDAVAALAEERAVPVENLLTPDYLRRLLWSPPRERDRDALVAAVAAQLASYGARAWQVDLTAPLLADAVIAGDVEPPAAAEAD
ncbi:MAG TPA: ribonuclease D, partial [Nocardioides sp.]